jgi:hypothetical protein
MSFSRKSPDSEELFGFDFVDRIPVGMTISSALCTLSVVIGEDAGIDYMLSQPATIVNATLVEQLVIQGKVNTKYCLDSEAVLADGQKVPMSGSFWVRDFCAVVSLVSLDQAKDHLRVDHDDDDEDIFDKVEQASAIILDYLKLDTPPISWGNLSGDSPPGTGVPKVVQSSVLLALGELHNKREASEVNVLSEAVKNLLRRSRDPALA